MRPGTKRKKVKEEDEEEEEETLLTSREPSMTVGKTSPVNQNYLHVKMALPAPTIIHSSARAL